MSQPTNAPPRRTDPDPPEDLGDEASVAARSRRTKGDAEAQVESLRWVMSDPRGRRWMAHLLAQKLFTRVGATRPPSIFTGNSHTFYNTSLRELGDLIASELNHYCQDDFRKMENETA